ncbi:integrase, partial [Enterobacter cloacae]|nr:integrase [Enterobacter cloacae]MDV0893786.1 integrase [Enterobacter cloacae]MDV0965978.1 integrase [Enterobacter cloacae]MDV0981431.1 integrase [Enterobacter cloacae]MDV1067206.1 integrase [Enterobacter cloacae]
HGDVLMWLMKTLLTSGCTNQRGAGHAYGKAGSHVPEKTISKYFKEARDKANIVWPKDCSALPPFHEQRSLSSRTYEAQGIDVKTLLGHKTEAMSAMYGDDRGLEWKKLVI